MTLTDQQRRRARGALRSAFVADALAMPVHWYYNPLDILRQFPGGISRFEAAPAFHPSSIMSLHSTRQGGRDHGSRRDRREVVGDVILKGRRQFWGRPNCHYHQGMTAGENTLNAHCARVLMRSLIAHDGRYDRDDFLTAYIDFMTADPPRHNDTYAESWHRGFFANLQAGQPADRCGAVTHDTASVGGLVSLAPLVFAALQAGMPLTGLQDLACQHLALTHPDRGLADIARHYVALLDTLLRAETPAAGREALARCARESVGLDVARLVARSASDLDVIGGRFSPACYISDSWPGLLYLAYRYLDDSRQALRVNTNLGGDNVHRGFVLGTLVGLIDQQAERELFDQLKDRPALDAEINALLPADNS